jgi:hypothetical protein
LAVPLALDTTIAVAQRLEPRGRRAVGAAIAVSSLALAAVGVATLVSDHRTSSDQAAMVVRQLNSGIAGPPGEAVVISSFPPIGRYAWRDIDAGRFVIVGFQDLSTLAPSLRAAGIDRFLLVTEDPDRDAAALRASFPDTRQLDERAGVRVLVVGGL